jgi:DNA polymerase-3 subunit alpha
MFLNCHTGFSFQYGTLPVKDLFNEARRSGVHKLAITEINNTASYLEMLRICDENKSTANGLTKFGKPAWNLEIAVGIEFRNPPSGQTGESHCLYIALAQNNHGFERLNRFLSHHNREKIHFPARAPEMDDVYFIYPFQAIDPGNLRTNEFIGVRSHQLTMFRLSPHRSDYSEKFVLLHPVTFLPPEKTSGKQGRSSHRDFNIHRLLRCIGTNTLLSKLPAHELASTDEFMVSEEKLIAQLEEFPELIENAQKLLAHCKIECRLHEEKNKRFFTNSLAEDVALLRSEAAKGYLGRYGNDPSVWNSHVEKELRVIAKKGFTAYYLIAYDLICFARQHGYEFVGRGSGANSTVAYCLGITNVDPIELDLYFERFLNEERTSPPDFDIDFSWDNRDSIYEYLFAKYGSDHISLLGTHVTYQGRSIIRELGKVFGLPKEEIDLLVEGRKRGTSHDDLGAKVYAYASYIMQKELPSNISIHAGGVLITEKPIYAYTATEFPPKELPVTHFEMHQAEDFGFFKFDILSQRGLGHIKETVKHIKRNRGVDVDINRFADFKKDEKIKDLMRNSQAMGCFYVESPAMRMLLGKLRCSDYLTLVAASSIIRPGVSSSGMMKAYIERFHLVRTGGTYESIHPKMDELMKETYGVMVYQEDVIRVAHYFAGLTLTEADVLRRGMSGKYRSREEFQRVKNRFFEGCAERGYDQKVTDRVWFEIESFSGYSFAKGHSASYAVESYQSLFLKAHYPLEFMVGVINNFGGFYQTEFYVHEARMNGGKIEAPCANQGNYLTSILGDRIFLGFIHLKSLEKKWAQHIEIERALHGPYNNLENFLSRAPGIGLEQVRLLIRIGAFRFTLKDKQKLLWEAMLFFGKGQRKGVGANTLFDTEPKEYPLPYLERESLDDAFDEIELLGFPLCDPFRLIAEDVAGDTLARELKTKRGKQVTIVGYLVTTKDTATKKGELMHFGTFNDRAGQVFDTVHFPDVARNFPYRGRGFYLINGTVTEEFGVYVVQVSKMEKVPMKPKRKESVTANA